MSGEPMDEVRQIADAVLYEGYLLWPYRRSALKNQKRWTFGGVYPAPYSRARGEDDPWLMRTECLVEGPPEATVDVRVRFLHVIRRQVCRQGEGGLEPVDELTVGDERYLSWEEATEREINVPAAALAALLDEPHAAAIDIPADQRTEWLADPGGERVGAVVRSWRALQGSIEVRATRPRDGVCTLTVTITNTTPWEGTSRDEALERTLVSTHTIAHTDGGQFVSQTDPPESLRPLVAECRNVGAWPVLVGTEGDEENQDTILSAPIILYDYPQIAPESPGNLFDSTEIDGLLTLNILTLTDAEKQEMRDSDPRARQLLERTDALSSEQLLKLHGALREFRPFRET